MKAGDVVPALLPRADEAAKLRPALVLSQLPPYGALLVTCCCAVSASA